MSDEKNDPTPEDLSKQKADPITDPERDAYEATIKSLREEKADLEAKLAAKEEPPKPSPKKKQSILERFSPL